MAGMPASVRTPSSPPALLVALVVLAAVSLAGCGGGAAGPARPSEPHSASAPPSTREDVSALEVLRRWDTRRAAAYSSGDARALRRLYAPGSEAGRRDLRLLQQYAGRGLVVDRLRTQVLAVELLTRSAGRMRLKVEDRIVGAIVRAGERRADLPGTRPATRVVTLVREHRLWRVSEVRRRSGR